MLYPPGFYFVKKPKRFAILSSNKSSEHNLSSFFDIKKPRKIEHLQSEEPFSSDPYFSMVLHSIAAKSKKMSHESTKMNTSSEIILLDSIQSPKGQVISKELFGRIENTKDCFRDLLTFNSTKQ